MPRFNEHSLRKDIARVWGEHGAHVDLFDTILSRYDIMKKKNIEYRSSIENFLDMYWSVKESDILNVGAAIEQLEKLVGRERKMTNGKGKSKHCKSTCGCGHKLV